MTFFLTRKLSLAALCLLAVYGPGQASADDKPIDGMAPGQKDGKDSILCDMRGKKSGKDSIRCDMRGVKSGKDSIRCDMRGTTPAAGWQMPNQPGNLDPPQIQTSPSFQKP